MRTDHTFLRQEFLRFFQEKGHRLVPSSSLIPQADPTLLFTNAGMNQFKGVFLGEENRPYSRATSCQKCMRAGGKHNDLEQVGYTARHHTFFEMLGNFSFGDYFKEEAISFAYEFLTQRVQLEPQRIWITVYKDDNEASRIWQKVGIPLSRILLGDEKDNFWTMGDTGPCGPCSEIYYDQGPDPFWNCPNPAECNPFCSCDRYLELWNLVFMQYDRKLDGTLSPLPRPSIDTGMGLERLCAVVQKVKSNYDTDLFLPLRQVIEGQSGFQYGEKAEHDIPMRVLMDHARAITFLVGDGILPGNEGRGYVLRRIIRRAIRFGFKLAESRSFLLTLTQAVIAHMGEVYPELRENEKVIREVVELEEGRFRETLTRGLKLFDETVSYLRKHNQKEIPGEVAFRLYDTYGFPRDLIQLMAREEGLTLDEAGLEEAMRSQREQARRAQKRVQGKGSFQNISSSLPPTEFVGYTQLEGNGRILAISGNRHRLRKGEEGEIILDCTPFYAESGGQVADRGWISAPGETRLFVLDVQKTPEGVFLHRVRVEEGETEVGDEVHLEVDRHHREGAALHHTATHMLQAALREILGTHVRQAGSLVEPLRLRFDFTHYQPVSLGEWRKIEDRVNEKIRETLPVYTEIVDYDTAIARGALAFFGDKYGERVRIVEIPGFSLELCGGTHVPHTGTLGIWLIRNETGVASGVRRIEALVGPYALAYIRELEEKIATLATTLRTTPLELEKRLKDLVAERDELERSVEMLRRQTLNQIIPQLLAAVKDYQGLRILTETVPQKRIEDLRLLADELRNRIPDLLILLGGTEGEKGFLFLSLPSGFPLRAGEVMKELAPLFHGRGGGSERSAQAGGGKASQLPRVYSRFQELLKERTLSPRS